jgi:uncharacterized protein (UPF0261 family)
MAKTIAILGTFDTKGQEFDYLRRCIEAAGVGALLIDCGVLDAPALTPDVSRDEVAAAGGTCIQDLAATHDRGEAITAMTAGAVAVIQRLFRAGRVQGLISLGGSAGTTIASAAMRSLPAGVPKLMVSTLASGDVRPFVGTKDILMMYPIVDIAGLNRLSRRVLGNAAAAICGMVSQEPVEKGTARPLIAATMFGVTTPCVTTARRHLEQAGCEVLVFHATGTGGMGMEELITDGYIAGVLDITTTELADELAGGVMSAGPARLEAAANKGVPQVVCPGAIDMVNFGPLDSVPERYRNRRLHVHNANVTLMRTTPDECAQLGRITAEKLNRATGEVVFLMPLRGVSAIDQEGMPFWWPEADQAYLDALKSTLAPRIRLLKLEVHINDESFSVAAADALLELMRLSGCLPAHSI